MYCNDLITVVVLHNIYYTLYKQMCIHMCMCMYMYMYMYGNVTIKL